jgi:hypothetical protein
MGFQGAGVFNILDGTVAGFQGAGVFNIAESSVHGFQGAGVFNVAGGTVNGFQAAGVANTAGGVNGIQAAGVLNTSGLINGAQLGLINVGGTANGLQVGLINVSRRMNGFALGLINVSGNGLYDPSVWSDDTGFTYAGFQLGAGAFYTLLYGGGPYRNPASALSFGLGLGIHADFAPFFFDVDASVKSLGAGADLGAAAQDSIMDFGDIGSYVRSGGTIGLFPMVRTTLGFTLFRRVSLIAGMSVEGHVPGLNERNQYFHAGNPWTLNFAGLPAGTLELYPRWYAGIRL